MFVGEVVQVGEHVTDFLVGDVVYGSNGMKLGAYAEFIRVDTNEAIRKVPKGVDPMNALCLVDGGITSLPYLGDGGKIKREDKVLVNGASGAVGSMRVMIAKHYDAVVTGVCSTSNVDTVQALGVDSIIDYTQIDFTNENQKYDIIFDAVGKLSYTKVKNVLSKQGVYLTTVPTLGVLIGP